MAAPKIEQEQTLATQAREKEEKTIDYFFLPSPFLQPFFTPWLVQELLFLFSPVFLGGQRWQPWQCRQAVFAHLKNFPALLASLRVLTHTSH